MSSIDRALDALDAAIEELAAADPNAVESVERYRVLDRLETARRRQIAVAHDHLARLEHVRGCPPPGIALADVLRISRAEARRRLRDADQLKARTTLAGEPLPPLLPATSTAWHEGLLDAEHLRVIQRRSSVTCPTTCRRPRSRKPSSRWPHTRPPCGPIS